ncbi:conserved hypothethical protein (plasmid) [Ralstonia solanacearum CMR15]|nr:conserved hypothethical protein [Ralstonia solanacearum CMR15]
MIDRLFLKILQRNWVDWGVISLGISGLPENGILEAKFVRAFADQELSLMDSNDSLLGEVSELALFNGEKIDEAKRNVARLCEVPNVDLGKAKRKWRVVALDELLSQLGRDPVYDLISLGDFWESWSSATDFPCVVQGVGNNLTPEEYYTERNLEETLNRHREWLRVEFESLS